jgi:hydrogenase large subunit
MKSKRVDLIEKIEGEAQVVYHYEADRVVFAEISFLTGRHIESILCGRPPLDALVINPRVCGICGHAHLIATVRALESCYPSVHLSEKSRIVRELTLSFELIQNHFKWFYLTVMPLLGMDPPLQRVALPSRVVGEMIALLAGQYPHNSYAIPGGIVGEITPIELSGVRERLNRIRRFFREFTLHTDPQDFLRCEHIEDLLEKNGDLPLSMQSIIDRGWDRLGRSHDRFIVFGGNSLFRSGKSMKTRIHKHLDLKYLAEERIEGSEAFNVFYRDKVYETGPLARALLMKTPLIKEAHRRFGDSIFSRILARVCEIPMLLQYAEELLDSIDLSQPAWIDPGGIPKEAEGVGIVEAARGSLIHRIWIEEGLIRRYEIVTPTQWNLGNGTPESPGVAQKGLMGLHRDDPAELVFKSFDICSACTTH